ncbi:unnamed protein product [marine sediment metagenome]|uniref:Uncharacterized protein n=1 Tax=marine sediment metagenome TaxID=412755 RepID=X1N8S4_9ZZZZ
MTVIEGSLEGHGTVLNALIERLGKVERQTEATRRKVYRDEEPASGSDKQAELPGQEQAPLDLSKVQPGDLVGPEYIK